MKNYLPIVLGILYLSNTSAQSVFDWEGLTIAETGLHVIRQTKAGVTASFTSSDSNLAHSSNAGTMYGSGNIIYCRRATTSATIGFSEAINVTSIVAFNFGPAGSAPMSIAANWTFTPVPLGANTAVTMEIPGYITGGSSTVVTLDFERITSIEVTATTVETTPVAKDDTFGFDNITFTIPESLSINNTEETKKITLFPNPSSKYIQLSNLVTPVNYRIFNISGIELQKGKTNSNQKINIETLDTGLYFLRLEEGNVFRFVKL